ncbi:MAG: SurA N-terminal domain-containing protein [bacterium]
MLDVLRKHASSWLIKLILGAIVISFVFFFGYSSMRKTSRTGKIGDVSAVASVNGSPIPTPEYQFFLDRNYERLRASFQGKEMPEFGRKMAESATMQQMVGRELAQQEADAMGIVIPDAELADAIRSTPAAQKDGEFDPIHYKHEFLPYFRNRFGLDYERLILQDLRSQALESTFQNVDRDIAKKELEAQTDNGSWTFEVVVFDPKAMTESGAVKSPEEATQAAQMLISADPRSWKGMLTPLKLAAKKVGPISVRERAGILEGQGTFEDYKNIFMLTKEHPVIGKPIERSGKFYVVHLVEMVKPGKASAGPWPGSEFFRAWMMKMAEKAKVVSYLKEEK